jgi:hypothetical protein
MATCARPPEQRGILLPDGAAYCAIPLTNSTRVGLVVTEPRARSCDSSEPSYVPMSPGKISRHRSWFRPRAGNRPRHGRASRRVSSAALGRGAGVTRVSALFAVSGRARWRWLQCAVPVLHSSEVTSDVTAMPARP